MEVVLAKVDASSESQLVKDMGLAGFPSLYWFAYGLQRPYGGGRRNETLVCLPHPRSFCHTSCHTLCSTTR